MTPKIDKMTPSLMQQQPFSFNDGGKATNGQKYNQQFRSVNIQIMKDDTINQQNKQIADNLKDTKQNANS